MPLVFRHGAAEVVFTVAVAVWAVFEFVMRIRQHLLSRGPAAIDRSAFVLLPCLVASIILAEALGRRGGLRAVAVRPPSLLHGIGAVSRAPCCG